MKWFWQKRAPSAAAAAPSQANKPQDPGVFKWEEQYRALHGGVHRKGASRVGTPTMTYHFALWMPPVDKDEEFQPRRDAWVADLDRFLASLILNIYTSAAADEQPISINARELRPEAGKRRFQFGLLEHFVTYTEGNAAGVQWEPVKENGTTKRAWYARYETVGLTFFYNHIPIKLRAELHTEYFEMSLVAALDCESEEESDGRSLTPLALEIKQKFALIEQICTARWRAAQDVGTTPIDRRTAKSQSENQITALQDAPSFFYKDFWARFETDILGPALTPVLPGPDKSTATVDLKDHLGTKFVDFRGLMLSTKMEEANEQNRDEVLLDEPFSAPARRSLVDYVKPEEIVERNQIHLLDALLPLIDAARRSHSHEDHLPAVEYAAASLHGRRAAYISALGPQNVFDERKEPVCYLIVAKHRHRWQISRIIDRFHTLGTLRTASLWDFDLLHQGGAELREIIRNLDRGDKPDAEVSKRAGARYRNALADRGYGGLQYRASRSRFYIDQFLHQCKELRFERIEGFQPYTAFVLRRVGRSWDFIRNLADRIAAVGKRLDTLNGEIRAQQELEQTTELTKLLIFAEWSAAVAVAYYGGHVVHEALVSAHAQMIVRDWLHAPLSPVWPLGTLMMIMLSIYGVIVWRINQRRKAGKHGASA